MNLDLVILALIADRPHYGYEIKKYLEQYYDSVTSVNTNTLYPILRRFVDAGYAEKSVIVDKYCASVDVLPTILNLFGVNYDSRLLAGNDILSDSEELVIFSDHSFITDKLKYDASTGEVKFFVDERYIGPDYIDETIEKVENILSVSDAMIEADYFSFVYGK